MSADAPVFTLSYDAELDDLIEWARMDPRRKRARQRIARSIVASLVIVGAITVLSVVLSRPSATGQAAPTWLLYLVVTFGWLRIVQLLRKLWQVLPSCCPSAACRTPARSRSCASSCTGPWPPARIRQRPQIDLCARPRDANKEVSGSPGG